MSPPAARINGLHHLTAIARSAHSNHRFYTEVLGLRLVKRTVNFDDPSTYHLYYGDRTGTPGSILTFFPWEGLRQGRPGSGQVTHTALAVPEASLGFWEKRLAAEGIEVSATGQRFGEPVMEFRDPDGLPLELVETADPGRTDPWTGGTVPAEAAIRGMHTVTARVADAAPTAGLLTGLLGLDHPVEEGGRLRFRLGAGGTGRQFDLIADPHGPRGLEGGGTVHHLAFGVAGTDAQEALRQRLTQAGIAVSPVIDRSYFHSIYFREPGGILFEIATDAPGFLKDEEAEHLGDRLMLPEHLEAMRTEIEAGLIALPHANRDFPG